MANKRNFGPRVLEHYLLTQLLGQFVMTTLALGLLVSGRLFATLLDRISGYSFPPDTLFQLWLYGSLKPLSLLMPFTVLIAVLLTFGRLYRDGEAYALFGSGVSYRRIYTVLIRFIAPIGVFLLVFELFLGPAVEREYQRLKDEGRARMDTSVVTEGKFFHPREGLAIFVNRVDGRRLSDIFAAEYDESGLFTIEFAKRGGQYREGGKRLLELSDGRRYLGVPGGEHYNRLAYETHNVAIHVSRPEGHAVFMPSSADPAELLAAGTTEAYAELQWRLSIPLAAVLMALLAFPLSFTPPRGNPQLRILFGLLAFLAYYGGLVIAHRAMSQGAWPLIPGAFAVHGVAAVALPLLSYRARVRAKTRAVLARGKRYAMRRRPA